MKYLFFDLEYATSKGSVEKICEFGYVLTDENFEVLEKDNFIIDPCIKRDEWDWRVVRKILNRRIDEYESSPRFDFYYESIKKLILGSDYVFGHTLSSDVKALNQNCERYSLKSFYFDFYDIKEFYREFSGTHNDTSVTNILVKLNINREGTEHDAEGDAYNTMLGLKEMLSELNIPLDDFLTLVPKAKDNSENYSIAAIEELKAKKQAEFEETKCGDGTNDIIGKWSINYKRFIQFLDNVKPQYEGHSFDNKKLSISINYEEHHFRQMLNIIQLIVNEGGEYILKASLGDIYVKYDVMLEDGTAKKDSKLNYVIESNNNGNNIEVIDFNEFLLRLSITEEQLDRMPMPSFDFLLDENAVIKNRKEASIIKRGKYSNIDKMDQNGNIIVYADKRPTATLGDLFGDVFSKFTFDD